MLLRGSSRRGRVLSARCCRRARLATTRAIASSTFLLILARMYADSAVGAPRPALLLLACKTYMKNKEEKKKKKNDDDDER